MPQRLSSWYLGFIEKALARGTSYTSLDAVKLIAIVNMTTDHIGNYFLPHELWWRAIGRITVPVWFALAGYSRSRAIGPALWIYGLLLIPDRFFTGHYLFPLNVLISIILCKYVLNFCEDRGLMSDKLPYAAAVCAVLTFFTAPLFEYGSIAFLFALYGRLVVTGERKYVLFMGILSYVMYIFWQFQWFDFTTSQGVCVIFGTLWVVWWLGNFRNSVLWPNWRTSRIKTFIAVLSRNTIPYYFYHRLVFEILGAILIGHGLHLKIRI